MSDIRKTSYSSPIIDLADDNASNNSHITQNFDVSRNIDRSNNRRIEFIDLIDDDQNFNSNIPIIDLTRDNDQFANHRVPVIDLTDDDAVGITEEIQCIDLTDDNAATNSHTTRYFDFTRNYDRDTNRRTELIYLTDDGHRNINPNPPVIDLTCNNEQFSNDKIPVIDTTHGDVQDITNQLQYIVLTDSEQQYTNVCIPTADLLCDNRESITETIPFINVTSRENHRSPIIDPISDNIVPNMEGQGIIDQFSPVDDLKRKDTAINEEEMFDVEITNCNNLTTSLQKTIAANDIPVENLRYDANEYDISKCSETSNIDLMHTNTSSRMQKYQPRQEASLMNYPLANKFVEKDIPGKFEKIFQNDASDFMKPARHPIPFRHSLGRSTINTSKNVPIEYAETSEGESRTLTVSSTFRRKKTKSSSDISKRSQSNPSEPSTSRANAFSLEAFKELFQKFWIFLFYWILRMIRLIIHTN